jgi:ribosomal protein S18 acetylase RimI-like enzyme
MLDRVSRTQLHRVWLEAFCDYAIDSSHVTEKLIEIRTVKNGVDFDLSVGAFDGDRMVGFTLIGLGEWEGQLAAYDVGTGIIPDFRGQGLAQKMFAHATPGLKERDVELFLLEVLQENTAAIRAYRKVGFEITREFCCFKLPLASIRKLPDDADISIRPVSRELVADSTAHLDWTPSWENSVSAILRIPDDLLLFGAFSGEDCLGTIAYSPQLESIMTLTVRRSDRRRGIAMRLLHHLRAQLPASVDEIKLINVQKSDHHMIAALARMGFVRWIDQFEMALKL